MKQKLTTTIVALASCLIANAEPDKEKRKGPRGDRPVPKEILEKFDKDKDGKLNEEERAAAMAARKANMEARRAEMMKKFDKDGDGKLSAEERKAGMEARRAAMMKKFDKDGDGKLNEEERKAAREAMPEQARRRARGGKESGPEGRGPKKERKGPKKEKKGPKADKE